jgi:hypothetical protein
MLIKFSLEKMEVFENDNKKSFQDGVKFSNFFKKCLNYVFIQFKKGDIEFDEFSNLTGCLKNESFLKVFFKVLVEKIKEDDKLKDNYNYLFGACFEVNI